MPNGRGNCINFAGDLVQLENVMIAWGYHQRCANMAPSHFEIVSKWRGNRWGQFYHLDWVL